MSVLYAVPHSYLAYFVAYNGLLSAHLYSASLSMKSIFSSALVTEISSIAYSIPLVSSAVLAWWSVTPSVVFSLECPYFFSNLENHSAGIVGLTGNISALGT